MAHPETLTEPEIDRLLYYLKTDTTYSHCINNRPRNYLMGCLMADAGLRVSEVVALKPGQAYEQIIESTDKSQITGKPLSRLYLPAKDTKNNNSRILPLTHRITYALLLYFEYHEARLSFDACRWMFPGRPQSTHVTTRQVHRIIDRAGRSALHRPVHPHLLRHTFATRIVRSTNTAVAQQLLGHKSLNSTQQYLHPNADDLSLAIEGLNKPKGKP